MLAWLYKILYEKKEIFNDIYIICLNLLIYFKNKFNIISILALKEKQDGFKLKNIDFKTTLQNINIILEKWIINIVFNLDYKQIMHILNLFFNTINNKLLHLYQNILLFLEKYNMLNNFIELEFYKYINKSIELIRLYYTNKNILEFKIYLYNKKIPLKKFKYNIKLVAMYIFSPLEFILRKNIKICYGTNIVRFHKTAPKFSIIEGKLKQQIKDFNTQLKIKIFIAVESMLEKIVEKQKFFLTYIFNLITIQIVIKALDKYLLLDAYLLKLLSKIYEYIKYTCNQIFFKINNLIEFINKLDSKKFNNSLVYFYSPLNLLNFIISDTCRTITFILIKLKKKWVIKFIIMYIFKKIIVKINYKLLKFIFKILKIICKFIYKCIASTIYFFISKTIYITIIYAYFYNEEAIKFLLYEFFYLYYDEISIYLNSNRNIFFINTLFNENMLSFLWPFACLQLILFWSRRVHDYYGNCLWTMTVFPMYLESYKIWYNKLICINFLNEDVFEWGFLLKYNVLQLFNYKIYNMYSLTTSLILIYLFIYFIRHDAYDYPYARFKKTRRHYIKYPIIICIIEIFRHQIILYSSTYIIYLNYKLKINMNICNWIYYIKQNYIPSYYYPNEHNAFINWETINLCNLLIPNPYLINFLIDLVLIFIAVYWLLKYTKEFLKIDNEFVASPIVAVELFIARIAGMYVCLYSYYYWFTWLTDLRLYVYIMYYVVFSYLYFVFRFNIIPRKTMPWYFRNIVELWPSTYFNQWSSIELMYDDQVRYVALRFKLKEYKIEYKRTYKEVEVWHKMIILKYQWQKDKILRFFIAYCRIMARKELMMREFNNYEYQGWYEDWEYNHPRINIYSWKLNLWKKPHIYILRKTTFFSGMRISYFFIGPVLESFSKKYAFLRFLVIMTKILDWFYTNKYVFIFESTEDNTQKRLDWKDNLWGQGAVYDELMHLKHLKRVLMEFSSGERVKTPDWQFPYLYEKEYKKKGWDMFKDPRIDLLKFDWRPKFKNLD